MIHIPLKQYLDSKRQLLNAVHNTPVTLIEYEIRKYCTLPIGESVDDSSIVALKPKQRIIIEWVYNNAVAPTPTKITFSGPLDSDDTTGDLFWPAEKLTKWLLRYAKDGINSGHTV